MATEKSIKFELINEIGVISASKRGWQKELNRVSWNGGAPKYDLREWGPDRSTVGKGLTFTEEELRTLKNILDKEIAFLDEE